MPLTISASAIVLSPGETDSVSISQKGEQLEILFNGQKLQLSSQESGMLELRGNLKGVAIDPDVKIPIKGIELPGPKTAKPSKGDSDLATTRQSEASFSAGITQRLLISGLKESAPPPSQAGAPVSDSRKVVPTSDGGSLQKPATVPQKPEGAPGLVPSGTVATSAHELSRLGHQLSDAITGGQTDKALNLIETGAPVTLLSTEQKVVVAEGLKDRISYLGEFPQAERGRDALLQVITSAQSPSEFKSVLTGQPAPQEQDGAPKPKSERPIPPTEFAERVLSQALKPAEFHASSLPGLPLPSEGSAPQSPGEPVPWRLADQPISSAEKMPLLSMVQLLEKGEPNIRAAMRAESVNITAGAFGLNEMASNPQQAIIGERAVSLGFPPQEVIVARKELVLANTGNGWPKQEVIGFASDPVAMAVASTDDKKSMIRALSQGHLSGEDQHAFLSIIGSSSNSGEFETLVKSLPSQEVISSLSDPDAVRSYRLLADGYGTPVSDKDLLPARTSENVLLDPEVFGRLSQASDQPPRMPELPKPGEIISSPRVTENYLLERLEAWAATSEPGAVIATVLENSVREAEGKPLLNPLSVRSELIRSIVDEGGAIFAPPAPYGGDKAGERKPEMFLPEVIRGIVDGEGINNLVMQQIVTAPLVSLLGRLSDQILMRHAAADTVLENRAKQMALQMGIDSRASGLATSELDQLRSMSGHFHRQLSDVTAALRSTMEPPGEPVSVVFRKLSEIPFENAGLGPILLRNIPHAEAVSRLSSLDVQPALQSMARLAAPGSDLSRVVAGTAEAIHLPEALRLLPAAFQRLDQTESATIALELRNLVEHGRSFMESIWNGGYSAALNRVQEFFSQSEDPSVRNVVAQARMGISFLNSLQHGSWKALFSVFGRNLVSFTSGLPAAKVAGPGAFSVPARTISRSPEPMSALIREFPDWSHKEHAQSLKEFRTAAIRFADTHSFYQAVEAVRSAKEFVSQVRTGNLIRMLSSVKQMSADSPVVQDILQRAYHLTTIGTAFLQPLLSREWEKPLEQTCRKNPLQKGLREVEGIFSSAVQSFVPLTSVDYLDSMWRYQKPFDIIRDEVFVRSMMDRYLDSIPRA